MNHLTTQRRLPSAFDFLNCEIEQVEREIAFRQKIETNEGGTVRFLENDLRRMRARLGCESGRVH